MGFTDAMEAQGFKPQASDDGEFKPLVGTYRSVWTVCRKEFDEKNQAEFIQVEIKPEEVINGDAFGDKFTFKKRFYLGGEKEVENMKKLAGLAFTAGVDPSAKTDAEFIANLANVIGKEIYIRSWGWKNEKGNQQMWVAQKPEVAEKKRTKDSLPI